ncbi:response regulator transcription factor [Phycicoccus sp. M110.8]|uniref:response regulator transcription factor n=1 Tax=Phycicoccus sp. M110.8 TaxID=3075433 RepID=UPI0028FDA098|nr:response regulator transcription factor [Phycicoccus sp. M110.8]MDU0313133.1 response regulator transcription factor [Phycicoccus sp. M110.8]
MAATLLVLEDDEGIRSSLCLALQAEGYETIPFGLAEHALAELPGLSVDLMLVDLMLGEMDGFTFVREVRQRSDVPIIVVSARADTHDIVAALESGADDYVTKPFQVKEVSARVRALRRRPPALARSEAEAVVLDGADGPLVLEWGAGTVRRGDQEIHLTSTEFRLLCELNQPSGRVLSRQALLDRVWERDYFGDERIVDVHIRRLRTKIERDPGRPELLVTVRGLGYRFDRRP